MSTMTTYTQYIRWSDELEQDVTLQALQNGEQVSVNAQDQDEGKTVFHRIARRIAKSTLEATERLNQARLNSLQRTGYYW